MEALNDFYSGKEILLLGGTGSLGKALLKKIQNEQLHVKGVRILSRDEYKQWLMKKDFGDNGVSYLIGDVRDKERLRRAFAGVDVVINCAAMKHVGACELNPIEAVQTNIDGAKNIIEAALDCNVKRVLHVSTDKAVYPVNLYGATKAVAEKLFLDSTVYKGGNYNTIFSCVRYGNVFGSRGSLVERILKITSGEDGGPIPLTDERMTRFFITLDSVTDFILERVASMESGKIYVPEMSGIKIKRLIEILAPGTKTYDIGMQQGEKLHECIVSKDEVSRSILVNGVKSAFVEIGKERKMKFYDSLEDVTSENCDELKEEKILQWKNMMIENQ